MSFIVGLTGGIAVGKSTVSRFLIEHDFQVIDADKITHQAYEKGTVCYQKIIQIFDCLDENQLIDRKKLGNIVFHDHLQKKRLESIVHPYVVSVIKKEIEESKEDIIFLDVPLLFEAHLEYLCDKIIVIYVDEKTQIKRLMERNQIDEENAKHLISQQLSLEEKKDRANYIIDNSDDLVSLYKNIEEMLEVIKHENVFK